MNTHVRRLFVLLVGFEFLPKSVSTRDRGARFILSEPVCAYLLDTESGWILLDTGIEPLNLTEPERAKAHYLDRGMQPPVVRAAHDLRTQLGQIGIGLADISQVVVTHLHLDHSGYLKYLPHAPVHIQRKELEFALGPTAGIAYFRSDYEHPDIQWRLHEGDWELVPGLSILSTPGHTPGHQSAVVRLPRSGVIVLPFDAGDLQENFDDEILPGETSDDAEALASIRRLKDIAASTGGQMILFHDPVQIQKTRLAPQFYD